MPDKVYLRALEPQDAVMIYEWRNDREVTDPLGGNIFFVSSIREEEWVKKEISNDRNLRLVICSEDTKQPIGLVNLTSIDNLNQSAEFSIMIGDKTHWGKGFGYDATMLCLKHAFAEMNLHRVYLTVRADNTKAKVLYEKAGFVTEGILRESVYKNNQRVNMVMMSVLRNEFYGKI